MPYLKNPQGLNIDLAPAWQCVDPIQSEYITELLLQTGVYDFLETSKAARAIKGRWSKMPYEKIAAEWRRLGRRLSAESPNDGLGVRIWDSRKLVLGSGPERHGVVAILLEIIEGGEVCYKGYYGSLQELAAVSRAVAVA